MVKNNFRNNYCNTNIICPLCNKEEDNQEHLFQCEKIGMIDLQGEYEDIFSDNVDTLHNVALKLKKIVEKRHCLLNPEDVNSCF